MPKIETLFLRVRDPAAQHRFYREILGMKDLGEGRVGYGNQEADICFLQADAAYAPKPNDLYWKIALSVPNIELACQQLAAKGVAVGAPRQFGDVGYLAHFTDPEGFTVELIEHWFKGNRPAEENDVALLGGGAQFNLITLRAADIEPVVANCLKWGMKPLCVQPLESYGFTLYFFAFTNDEPPSADLTAIENREWLYQRKYTILEVQHVPSMTAINVPEGEGAHYTGLSLSGLTIGSESKILILDPSAE